MANPSSNRSDLQSRDSRPARTEWTLLAAIVLLGIMLRCAWPSRMAVEHFDEGVYASNLWFGVGDGFRYPLRHLYAPPLLPWLVEWSIIFFGPSHLGSMLPGLLFGVLTIPLIWWVARCWFGAEAGLAAAALVSLSDVHVLYSRTVLTDVPLCFWLLLAVYFISQAYRTAHLGWMLAAGTATGLAWSTKYNGWLPLAIGLAGLVPWLILRRAKDRPIRSDFLCWVGIAVVAGAVWSPSWYDLQLDNPDETNRGGYAAVAENHRGYLVGLAGWFDAFLRQVANHRHFDGMLTTTSFLLAVVAANFPFVNRSHSTWNGEGGKSRASRKQKPAVDTVEARQQGDEIQRRSVLRHVRRSIGTLAVTAVVCAMVLGSSVLLGLAAVLGMAVQLWPAFSATDKLAASARDVNSALPCWLLAAWFCGLLVSTPFYTPFPRLTLPWLMSAWLGTAAAIGWWSQRLHAQATSDPAATTGTSRWSSRGWLAVLLMVAAVMVWLVPRAALKRLPGWQARNSLETVAIDIVSDVRHFVAADRSTSTAGKRSDLPDFVLYVYAEPALVFHLSAIGFRTPGTRFVVQPVGNLGFADPDAERPPVPTFLVTRPRARRNVALAEPLARYRYRAQLPRVATYDYAPSDLVLLNDYHPRDLVDRRVPPGEGDVHLYRLE